METETPMLEIAFNNMAEELKEVRLQQAETNKTLSAFGEKLESFGQRLSNLKVITPPINTVPIAHTIDEGIMKIKSTIEDQPKSIIRQFKILQFPEYNAGEYYRIVFGRILFWLFVFLTVTYLYLLGQQYIQMDAIVKINKLENDNIRKAWKYLYKHSGKTTKDKMDSAYQKNKDRL
jgi:hypothetical protein